MKRQAKIFYRAYVQPTVQVIATFGLLPIGYFIGVKTGYITPVESMGVLSSYAFLSAANFVTAIAAELVAVSLKNRWRRIAEVVDNEVSGETK